MNYNLENISLQFAETKALNNVSLNITSGEQIVLLGPSGAGKTSLLRLFNLGMVPTSGTMYSDSVDINKLSLVEIKELRSKIGVVYQDLRLLSNVRVFHNIVLGRLSELGFFRALREFLYPSRRLLSEVFELLKKTGIENKIFIPTEKLSGGEQQRVAIARALFQHPQMLIADEPVSSVDPERALEILSLLKSVALEQKASLVVSLHNPELAIRMFPRIIGLRKGEIVFDKPAVNVSKEDLSSLYEL